jgi:hypothetical protein
MNRENRSHSVSESGEDDLESNSENEGWGKRKAAYYSTNSTDLQSEDEESNELFLQETVRLQSKSRRSLSIEDFGLQDYIQNRSVLGSSFWSVEILLALRVEADRTSRTSEVICSEEVLGITSHEARPVQIEKVHPEQLALSRDWRLATVELSVLESKLSKFNYFLYFSSCLTDWEDRLNTDQSFDYELGLLHLYHGRF